MLVAGGQSRFSRGRQAIVGMRVGWLRRARVNEIEAGRNDGRGWRKEMECRDRIGYILITKWVVLIEERETASGMKRIKLGSRHGQREDCRTRVALCFVYADAKLRRDILGRSQDAGELWRVK